MMQDRRSSRPLVIAICVVLALWFVPGLMRISLLLAAAGWLAVSEALQSIHVDPFAVLWFTLLLIGAAAGYQLDHIAREVRAIRQRLDALAGSEQNSRV
jgi:hypothetical protein